MIKEEKRRGEMSRVDMVYYIRKIWKMTMMKVDGVSWQGGRKKRKGKKKEKANAINDNMDETNISHTLMMIQQNVA